MTGVMRPSGIPARSARRPRPGSVIWDPAMSTDGAMAVGARATAFGSVLASAQATGASGDAIEIETAMRQILDQFAEVRLRGGTAYFAGNGGARSAVL